MRTKRQLLDELIQEIKENIRLLKLIDRICEERDEHARKCPMENIIWIDGVPVVRK